MTKLCPRGKAAAKRKFAVYPSAYANAYASKICAGKIKDPSGKKRKDFRGPKPAAEGAMINKPKKAALGAIIGLGAAALGKKLLGKKTKQAMPQKGIGPIASMAEKQAKKRKEFMGAKKGALMIVIGVGKKKKVDKKMGGGMTAGSQSALGRLQKARMMNKGGDAKIKKVISGLHKASALHKSQAKSLQTVVGKSAGGMADYYKDLM